MIDPLIAHSVEGKLATPTTHIVGPVLWGKELVEQFGWTSMCHGIGKNAATLFPPDSMLAN